MTHDTNTPEIVEIVANHETRLHQLEHQVGLLEGRMPVGKWGRVVWWLYSLFLLLVPIIGGAVALFVNEEWGRIVVAAAFGVLVGRTSLEFLHRVASGPVFHRSILLDDHRA